MARPILIAGLLGGLLGGLFSFTAGRWLVPAHAGPASAKPAPPAQPVPPEARAAADAYVARLNALKYDEFVGDVNKANPLGEKSAEAETFRKEFLAARTLYHGTFGDHIADLELLRETAVSPDLAQFVYLERFERAGVVWFFVFYNGKDGWRLNRVLNTPQLMTAFPGATPGS